ncbi:MAG: UDP-N-acetylmuramoyl-L-alanyl-D-glutamate--2,6-diaminopimelate ligase [Endomicrobia bacterium]|nr:UDP-N-acetylmuramoyl-L-alanyl-D-glutamate--2,6-diaminopimelate ligase [Endomicrobiia bacterium]
MQKHISSLIENINILKVQNKHLIQTLNVSGIKYNSKLVTKGDIFVCLPGTHTDGILYIDEAVRNGASVIVTQKDLEFKYADVLLLVVDDIQTTLAKLAANFYENPTKNLLLIGITGTNGKTTTSYLLENIFLTAGYKTGVIGTINYRYDDKIIPANNTTPFASDLQAILYEMLNSGVKVVIMEVSSHALAQKRVAECEFDIAIFTNLSPEHLDYHHNMEEYFNAKSLLFKSMTSTKKECFNNSTLGRKVCVINYDDEYGKRLINLCPIKDILLYSKGSKNKNGKFTAVNIHYKELETEFEIVKNNNLRVKINTQLIGEFNVYNILAAFVAAYSQGVEVEHIVEGIKKVKSIPGRLEKVEVPADFSVIIDYAHTPEALEKVLLTLKQIPHNRIITVFGCGGDRDRSKRPIMGSIATSMSDYVIVTSDNPRTEEPQKILLDIEVGIKKINKQNYEIIVDRKEAIFKALSLARTKDIILLAGKGHEDYQIIGTEKIHFDEREIVKEFFKK